jgi:TatD DNase family protein
MIDSHCHLADEAFTADLEDVVARAKAAGVERLLCILAAGDLRESEQAARLSAVWPEVRFAAGVHPHQAGAFAGDTDRAASLVRETINEDSRIRAVGEIGLDYHYDFAPRDVQRDVFRAQVSLARELGRPIVIHTREATDDTFEILDRAGGGEVRGVFHCFTGDAAMARRALDSGFHVSFAGIVSFPRASALREAARVVPRERLLVETDAPYLAPVPHRGRRNEPAWVAHTIAALAEARGETVAEVAAATCAAFDALIGP